ncbi:hypothetical protein MUP46_02595 [Patescibacteria group bacterium]|nr:hypothetical protein [Patescibacteria group bacterium]
MTLTLPKIKYAVFFILFVTLIVFTRFYNLDKTARFLWDESSDLVRMHQIYVEKKLTLIGPISEDGNKVFSSLTYYMFMPFAILGHFDPVSTAYGSAFWGILTICLLSYLTYKVNTKMLFLALPIFIFWYPLVETGRWAWNPNLIPLWVTLALIFYSRKGLNSKFLSGLFMGLSIHQHYLAIFASAGLALVIFVEALKEKNLKKFFVFILGIFITLLPFVIFDLTHPPGLFLSRILYFNYLEGTATKTTYLSNFFSVISGSFQYFTQSVFLKIMLFLSISLLVLIDIKNRSKALPFVAIFFMQILGLSLVKGFSNHYILAGIPFFIVYLIYPRKNASKILSFICLGIILISSIFSFPEQIKKITWESDIASTRYITNIIQKTIQKNDLKNANLAVLASDDPNTYGRRYRDLLLLRGLTLKTKGEYDISDALFVISTSSLDAVRKDNAYEIDRFRSGPLVNSWEVPDSNWRIFLFSRSI